jgi:hypothetical protein
LGSINYWEISDKLGEYQFLQTLALFDFLLIL